MAKDIFGKNVLVSPGPLARAETFEVYVGDPGSSTFIGLAQGVQNSYSQPLQRVNELGSFRAYMVSGRPDGSLSITRLVGKPGGGVPATTLISLFQNIAGGNFLEIDGSRGGTITLKDRITGAQWVASGCYITQETTGVDANGVMVSEQIAIQYQKLEYVEVGGTPVQVANDINPG